MRFEEKLYQPDNEQENGNLAVQERPETKAVDPSEAKTIIIPPQETQKSGAKTKIIASKASRKEVGRILSGDIEQENDEALGENATAEEILKKTNAEMKKVSIFAQNQVLEAAATFEIQKQDIQLRGNTIEVAKLSPDSDIPEMLTEVYQDAIKTPQKRLAKEQLTGLGLSNIIPSEQFQDRLIQEQIYANKMIGSEVYYVEGAQPEIWKVYRDLGYDDRVGLRRFVSEMTSAASLDHENVVKLNIGGINDNGAYFSMEYLEGGNLYQKLFRNRDSLPLFAEEGELSVLSIASDVGNGLMAINQSGIVHRDLKPANILLSGGKAKVSDFGIIAKIEQAMSRTDSSQVAETNQNEAFSGTPGYVAPESFEQNQYSYKSDAFAYGVVLFELATGKHFYEGSDPIEIMMKVTDDTLPADKLALLDDVPEDYRAAVIGLLQKDPKSRMNLYQALQKVELSKQKTELALRSPEEKKQRAEDALKKMPELQKPKKQQLVEKRREKLSAKTPEERKQAAKEALKKLQAIDAKNLKVEASERASQRKKREERTARLTEVQSYQPAEVIRAKKKPSVFKRAWGGIKSLFGRK